MMDSKKMSETQLMEGSLLNKRKFTETEKMTILLKGLRSENNISRFCNDIGINTDQYYQWKKDILEIDDRDYGVLRNGEAKKEINRLEIENIYLKQLVEDLKLDNDKLRKSFKDRVGKIVRKI